jgi:hypothetical protein
MDRCFSRAALAAVLGLGALAGLAPAQGVRIVPEAAPAPVVVAGGVPVDGEMVVAGPEGADGDHSLPGHFPRLRHGLNKLGVACWTWHDSVGCGSLKADCTFIFGSCRVWYGEPCLPGPPPSPAAYYYQMKGYAGPGTGQPAPPKGCACQQ